MEQRKQWYKRLIKVSNPLTGRVLIGINTYHWVLCSPVQVLLFLEKYYRIFLDEENKVVRVPIVG